MNKQAFRRYLKTMAWNENTTVGWGYAIGLQRTTVVRITGARPLPHLFHSPAPPPPSYRSRTGVTCPA
jgi:hypothetical protein